MQQTGQKGCGLILSVQTFKKCPFYAGFFLEENNTPQSQTLNVRVTHAQNWQIA
jgi:hypothetical protein